MGDATPTTESTPRAAAHLVGNDGVGRLTGGGVGVETTLPPLAPTYSTGVVGAGGGGKIAVRGGVRPRSGSGEDRYSLGGGGGWLAAEGGVAPRLLLAEDELPPGEAAAEDAEAGAGGGGCGDGQQRPWRWLGDGARWWYRSGGGAGGRVRW